MPIKRNQPDPNAAGSYVDLFITNGKAKYFSVYLVDHCPCLQIRLGSITCSKLVPQPERFDVAFDGLWKHLLHILHVDDHVHTQLMKIVVRRYIRIAYLEKALLSNRM